MYDAFLISAADERLTKESPCIHVLHFDWSTKYLVT